MAKERSIGADADRAGAVRIPAPPITDEDKGYARTAVRLKIARAIWSLWDELRAEQGLDQTWLVERLGSNKGRVSRLLNGPGNWTLDTVADLLEAMDGRLTGVEVKRHSAIYAGLATDLCLNATRDRKGLWNVIVSDVEGDDAPAMLESRLSPPPTRYLFTACHIVSDEAA